MRQILFVDDEPNVLKGLQRMLRTMRDEWEVQFAGSGEEALTILDERPIEALVSDMRMPGMDGLELLKRTADLHPEVIRVILSGQSELIKIAQSVGATHQYLSKPCDADELIGTLKRALRMRDILTDERLQSVVSRCGTLPSLPEIYKEFVAEVEKEDPSIPRLGEIVSRDVAMSAKILQLVNSAFFGVRRRVTNVEQAASLLGLDTMKALVLTAQAFAQFQEKCPEGFSIDELQSHSISVGTMARRFAFSDDETADHGDDAMTSGMLHDIGKLVIASALPEEFTQAVELAKAKSQPLWLAEQKILGITHAQVGAYLIGLWGLPDDIVEAVALHHDLSLVGPQVPPCLVCVHAADAIEHGASDSEHMQWLLDKDSLERLKLTAKVDEWRLAGANAA